jgi:hypothetical protein
MNFLATLLQTIAFVPALVRGIESLFSHRTGTEKKAAALSFLQAALSTDSAAGNPQIVDREKFKEGMGKIIDGTVECLNASVWVNAKGQ